MDTLITLSSCHGHRSTGSITELGSLFTFISIADLGIFFPFFLFCDCLLKLSPYLLTLSNCVGRRLPTLSLTVGAVPEAGFRRMFVILHDNVRNARDTYQAVNRSLSIFLGVTLLELMMQ